MPIDGTPNLCGFAAVQGREVVAGFNRGTITPDAGGGLFKRAQVVDVEAAHGLLPPQRGAGGRGGRSAGRELAIRPFLFGLILIASGVGALGIVIFPRIVPFQLSLRGAASETFSRGFMLVGAHHGHADRARLFGVRLGMVLWFDGLYLSSVALLLLACLLARATLHLITMIPT